MRHGRAGAGVVAGVLAVAAAVVAAAAPGRAGTADTTTPPDLRPTDVGYLAVGFTETGASSDWFRHWIEYGTSLDYGSVCCDEGGQAASFSRAIAIQGLQPGTTYHVRSVIVQGLYGTGPRSYGADLTVTTKPPEAPGFRFDFTRWLPEAPGMALRVGVDPHGLATEARIEYGTTGSLGASTDPVTVAAETWGQGGIDTDFFLPRLLPSTTYYWRAVLRNALGTTATPLATFTTGIDATAPPPPATTTTVTTTATPPSPAPTTTQATGTQRTETQPTTTASVPTLSVAAGTLPSAMRGSAYEQPLVSGGRAPYTAVVTDGALPAGVRLGPSGALVGTPHEDGSFEFTLRVTDADGRTADGIGSLQVDAPALRVATRALRPSRARTPGRTDSRVRQGTIRGTICRTGWARSRRPPRAYLSTLLRKQLRQYGAGPAGAYVEDHLIPIELGGHPRSPANLWPELRSRARRADRLEASQRRRVCAGTLTLAAARLSVVRYKRANG